jgi:hypothetical protein
MSAPALTYGSSDFGSILGPPTYENETQHRLCDNHAWLCFCHSLTAVPESGSVLARYCREREGGSSIISYCESGWKKPVV